MTTHNPPESASGPETSVGADLTPIRQAALPGEGSLGCCRVFFQG